MNWIKNNLKFVIVLGVALVLVISLISKWISIRNEGVRQEAVLTAQFKVNQNELSGCLTKIADSANLTKAQVSAMTEALTEAVKGRYDGRTANPGQMFSAIVEQYPDLKPYDAAFSRAYTTIIGCRSDYKLAQDKLLGQIQVFDTWRQSFPTSMFTDTPSSRLLADGRTGQQALDKMRDIVLTKEARKTYETGELEVPNPWGTQQ